MLNLAHVMSVENRARGLEIMKKKEILKDLIKPDGVYCTAEDFVKLILEYRKLSADHVYVVGDVFFGGDVRALLTGDLRLPNVEIYGNLIFSNIYFQGELDISLVTVRGIVKFADVSVGRDLILPSNYVTIKFVRDKLSVLGRKLSLVNI